jgi:replicative DNA helicase
MLASDLKVPILALSQVNRKCEERKDKRPVPSDLRESGNLEQDATAVMFVYRDEEYNDNTKEPGIAEINVAINRNGTKGIQKYYMDFPHMRLSNLDNRS